MMRFDGSEVDGTKSRPRKMTFRTDNGYEEFQIIETMYTGKTLEQVSEIKKGQEAIVRNEAEEALQAKIRLLSFIETAIEQN